MTTVEIFSKRSKSEGISPMLVGTCAGESGEVIIVSTLQACAGYEGKKQAAVVRFVPPPFCKGGLGGILNHFKSPSVPLFQRGRVELKLVFLGSPEGACDPVTSATDTKSSCDGIAASVQTTDLLAMTV